ncbi:hypothetical protein SLE2022_239780 [Rubroshorea leprosula]
MPEKDFQEPLKPRPEYKPKQTETPTPDRPWNESSAGEQEEAEEMEDETKGEKYIPELDRDKGLSERAGESKKKVSKRHKLCAPFVVAGSTLLISLLVMVIHIIRSRAYNG